METANHKTKIIHDPHPAGAIVAWHVVSYRNATAENAENPIKKHRFRGPKNWYKNGTRILQKQHETRQKCRKHGQ